MRFDWQSLWQLDRQLSVGRLAEFLPPAAYALSAVASALVLADARRRSLGPFAAAAWAVFSFLFPHVAVPLYLLSRLYSRRAGTVPEEADEETTDKAAEDAPRPPRRLLTPLPLVYAAALLAFGALYFYLDYRSADARLARAEGAKLEGRTERAVAEYRAALRLREDPHVRKLLGLELVRMNRWDEALTEFQAAARGGEPDDALHLHTAAALSAAGRPSEATDEYRLFLQTPTCTQATPDPRCAAARTALPPD